MPALDEEQRSSSRIRSWPRCRCTSHRARCLLLPTRARKQALRPIAPHGHCSLVRLWRCSCRIPCGTRRFDALASGVGRGLVCSLAQFAWMDAWEPERGKEAQIAEQNDAGDAGGCRCENDNRERFVDPCLVSAVRRDSGLAIRPCREHSVHAR